MLKMQFNVIPLTMKATTVGCVVNKTSMNLYKNDPIKCKTLYLLSK